MWNSRKFINVFRTLYFLSFRIANILAELYQFYGGEGDEGRWLVNFVGRLNCYDQHKWLRLPKIKHPSRIMESDYSYSRYSYIRLNPNQIMGTLNKIFFIFSIREKVYLPQQDAIASSDVWAEEQFQFT